MATTDIRVQQIQSLLAACTPQHAAQIIQALQIAGSQAPSPANTMVTPKVKKTQAKQSSKKAKPLTATGGPKRPLNSWMAFRNYYNASLAPHTQKAISKILMMWWRDDPFEAKWAILAKAYSILRGAREKEDAPLDDYFRLAAPKIGVIPPAKYQEMMGWLIRTPSGGDQMPQVTRAFVPDFNTFPEMFRTTNCSVDDLVKYCKTRGYGNGSFTAGQLGPSSSSAQGSLTMAVQPNATKKQSPLFVIPEAAAELGIITPVTAVGHNLFENLATELATGSAEPAGQAILNDATAAVGNADTFPYNNLFDPASNFDISFNPTAENDTLADGGKWDAFNPSINTDYDGALDFSFSQFVNDGMF